MARLLLLSLSLCLLLPAAFSLLISLYSLLPPLTTPSLLYATKFALLLASSAPLTYREKRRHQANRRNWNCN